MSVSAKEAFDAILVVLDTCQKECSSAQASLVAKSLGFSELATSDRQTIVSMIYRDHFGDSVTLLERWRDPSGPFQNLPDIHRLRLVLDVAGTPPVERGVEYEG